MAHAKVDHSRQAPATRAEAAVAVLTAAGLQVERVEHCPDPACPVCAAADRAAA